MKEMKQILAASLMLFALCFGAVAQFVSGPATGSALTTTSPVGIAGSTTSNVVSTIQQLIPVGPLGVGFAVTVYGTNAASTTNATIRLEGTVDGVNWIASPSPIATLSIPQSGTTVYTVYTNILPNAVASQNVGNLRYLRVASIQNTNLATIWVSNFVWSIKQ